MTPSPEPDHPLASTPEPLLHETFRGPALDPRLRWLNPPPVWSLEAAGLVMHPAALTDFWQATHYGFRADTGHFLHLEVAGDFVLSTRVRFHPAHLYDQAGLMVRLGPTCWIKTSVEYELAGPSKLGVVVTNHGYSDWSLQDFSPAENAVRLRICRQAQDFLVDWGPAVGGAWDRLRVTHLHEGEGQPIQCGPYACSPKGGGFRAEFDFLHLARAAETADPPAS